MMTACAHLHSRTHQFCKGPGIKISLQQLDIAALAGGTYAPKASLATVGVACLFGISITARGETQEQALRVNEFRLNAFVKRDAEADPKQNLHSNLKVGKLVADLAMSNKKGEVVNIGNEDLTSTGLDVDKLNDAGIV